MAPSYKLPPILVGGIAKIWVASYVDDFFAIEPEATAHNAPRCVVTLASLLGLELSPNKQVAPIYSAQLLGARVSFLRDRIIAEITDGGRQVASISTRGHTHEHAYSNGSGENTGGTWVRPKSDLITGGPRHATASHTVAIRKITPPAVVSGVTFRHLMVGKCGFRAFAANNSIQITQTGRILLRRVRRCPIRRVLANSNSRASANTNSAQRRADHPDKNIAELKMSAALLAFIFVDTYRPNLPRLLLVDNAAVVSCLINGTGESTLARKVMMISWRLAALRSVFVWVEWAPAGLQIADPRPAHAGPRGCPTA